MAYQFSDRHSGQSLLHTPEGVRDIYNGECETKLRIQENMHKVLKLHGFKDIQTPMFEFFDIFNKERGTVASKDMFKFFDREGNTLVLRPDLTPSAARCVAKYYREEELPIRLCYMGNTFINNSSYQGKLKEVTQLGAELVNDDTSDGDAQMIALTIECLLSAGLKEFQVEIGHADFLLGLLSEGDFDEEESLQLKELIENKNMFGMEDLISKKTVSNDWKELILRLPEMFGGIENLTYAKTKTQNKQAQNAITRLEKLYYILQEYGLSDYVTFDLGILSKYNYYTGIIFKAYTYGNGEAVVKGGRYDHLVGQFGKQAPAVGMAVVVDQLMAALSRQKLEEKDSESMTMILYQEPLRKIAIHLAGHFRNQGMKIELIRKSSKRSVTEYQSYGKRENIGGILYIDSEETIHVMNIETGSTNLVHIKDLMEQP